MSRVRAGWTGREPGERVWTFSSSLMFSLAISTTIGSRGPVTRGESEVLCCQGTGTWCRAPPWARW